MVDTVVYVLVIGAILGGILVVTILLTPISAIQVAMNLLGLAVVAAVAYGGYRVWSAWNTDEWICQLDNGTVVVTEGEPSGQWVESTDGQRYPMVRVVSCEEL